MPSPKRHWIRWMVLATAAALLVVMFEVGGGTAFREAPLRSVHSHPGTGVPAELMVVVAASGKTFHVTGCTFLHDKTSLRTITASEAIREGYAPCVRCMKEYLSAEAAPAPAGDELLGVALRDENDED